MRSKSRFIALIVGRPGFDRYVIQDNRVDDERYFVSPGVWTDNIKGARKYADIEDLSADIQEVNVLELGHMGVKRYILPVEVTVLGTVNEEDLQRYLFNALQIALDYQQFGNGPHAESVVMVKTLTTSLQSA